MAVGTSGEYVNEVRVLGRVSAVHVSAHCRAGTPW